MRYADPLAQAEIDRLWQRMAEVQADNVQAYEDGAKEAQAEIDRLRSVADKWSSRANAAELALDRLRACSDPTPPAEGERHTAEQLWHHLLEASSHRRLYVLNQFLEAQDDALRCFLEHGLELP